MWKWLSDRKLDYVLAFLLGTMLGFGLGFFDVLVAP